MNTFNMRFDKLDNTIVEELQPSFNDLPETDHKDGKYRLRKYALVELAGYVSETLDLLSDELEVLEVDTFNQSSEYNKHQGDIDRKFEPICTEVLFGDAMLKVLRDFCIVSDLDFGDKIHIHQIRVITSDNEAEVSPEGVHQDGYEFVGFVGINRYNVTGGELMLYHQQDQEPFIKLPIPNGVMITIKDNDLWHNGSPIQPKYNDNKGYLDLFVLTASEI